MFVLKAITTVLIACIAMVTVYSMDRATDKSGFVGFYIMFVVYVLSVICIWN